MAINFNNVTDIMLGQNQVTQIEDSLGNVLWSATPPAPTAEYFYVEDISGADNTLTIAPNNESQIKITVYQSTDKLNWVSMGTTSNQYNPLRATIPANSKLYLRCETNRWGNNAGGGGNMITTTGQIKVGGNIMSLLYGSNFTGTETSFPSIEGGVFKQLFYNNTNLIGASNLILPAMHLAYGCYDSMFNGCTSLTTAPALPSTNTYHYCYQNMFRDCTSLTTAPALPATTLNNYCYSQMFSGCTSLTTAPELPATTLKTECYRNMFYDCSLINEIVTYATDITATNCLMGWLDGVAAQGEFYNLGNPAPTYPSGASGIPTGWTEHTSL